MILAVDTGASKTLMALFNRNGEIQIQHRFRTPNDTQEYAAQVARIIEEWRIHYPLEAITVALPGIIKDEVALWCNNLGWKDFDVKEALGPTTGEIPVFVENDANLGGLSEAKLLPASPALAIYITVSTGIGTGVISEGHIYPPLQQSEGGKMMIEFESVLRPWESFASGKALARHFEKLIKDVNPRDTTAWSIIAERISRGLLALIPLLQPNIIIMGGSVGAHYKHYEAQLNTILEEKLPPYLPRPIIKQAVHAEEAVIYGGYFYALDKLTSQ